MSLNQVNQGGKDFLPFALQALDSMEIILFQIVAFSKINVHNYSIGEDLGSADAASRKQRGFTSIRFDKCNKGPASTCWFTLTC